MGQVPTLGFFSIVSSRKVKLTMVNCFCRFWLFENTTKEQNQQNHSRQQSLFQLLISHLILLLCFRALKSHWLSKDICFCLDHPRHENNQSAILQNWICISFNVSLFDFNFPIILVPTWTIMQLTWLIISRNKQTGEKTFSIITSSQREEFVISYFGIWHDMYMKTGNTLLGLECLAAELYY